MSDEEQPWTIRLILALDATIHRRVLATEAPPVPTGSKNMMAYLEALDVWSRRVGHGPLRIYLADKPLAIEVDRE